MISESTLKGIIYFPIAIPGIVSFYKSYVV